MTTLAQRIQYSITNTAYYVMMMQYNPHLLLVGRGGSAFWELGAQVCSGAAAVGGPTIFSEGS